MELVFSTWICLLGFDFLDMSAWVCLLGFILEVNFYCIMCKSIVEVID